VPVARPLRHRCGELLLGAASPLFPQQQQQQQLGNQTTLRNVLASFFRYFFTAEGGKITSSLAFSTYWTFPILPVLESSTLDSGGNPHLTARSGRGTFCSLRLDCCDDESLLPLGAKEFGP